MDQNETNKHFTVRQDVAFFKKCSVLKEGHIHTALCIVLNQDAEIFVVQSSLGAGMQDKHFEFDSCYDTEPVE